MTRSRTQLFTIAVMTVFFAFVSNVHASDTIKEIKGRGTLRVCFAETAPMAVRDPATGKWSGYNVSMAEDLARELGVKLETVDDSYATVIPSLMSGKCDIIMAPLLVNAQRAQVVAFTDYYSTSGNQAVVRQDASFQNWEQLNDEKVTFAVSAGTQDEALVKRIFPKAQVKPVVSENTYAAMMEIAAGRADAGFTDTNSARNFTKQNPQLKLKVLEPDRISNPAGRAYAARPDDWHFVNFLNNWLYIAKGKFPQQ